MEAMGEALLHGRPRSRGARPIVRSSRRPGAHFLCRSILCRLPLAVATSKKRHDEEESDKEHGQ